MTKSTFNTVIGAGKGLTLAGVPSGYDGELLAAFAAHSYSHDKTALLHIARDDSRAAMLRSAIQFFGPDIDLISLPAWDTLPYDRVGPHSDIVSRRMAALAQMGRAHTRPRVIITTINAALQRLPSRDMVSAGSLILSVGDTYAMEDLIQFLVVSGYSRSSQVTEPGEFAVRGGLLDIFPSGADAPLRLDFFGDNIDSLRVFDPITQRSEQSATSLKLLSASEVPFSDDARQLFRRNYVNAFGPNKDGDPLYDSVVDGRPYQGMEHWLPFFHDRLETVFDHARGARVTLDHQLGDVAKERLTAIDDYFEARQVQYEQRKGAGVRDTALMAPIYKPVPVDSLFIGEQEWDKLVAITAAHRLSPFAEPDSKTVINWPADKGRNFAPERGQSDVNVYDAVAAHIDDLRKDGKRVIFSASSAGAADRLKTVLEDHGVAPVAVADNWADIQGENSRGVAVTELSLETGFVTPTHAFISEQDVLGDKLARKSRKTRKAEDFLRDASTLAPGDVVVHAAHGIGRFEGLETVTAAGAAHDCVLLTYHGGDKLYVPVENIEMLSRHGSDSETVQLDKLGGVAWQARKARMKKRIREMADGLIKLAAQREMKTGATMAAPEGLFDEFCARFPYVETDDQLRAIEDVVADLMKGRPMDRLVCGDVGFGKTEIALRAAFLAVMAGYQVAVVAPTTLLARQHYQTFTERFAGLPVRIGQLSRLVKPATLKANKDELSKGQLDIAVGTHALLSKDIRFDRLGMLIIDEEQHFGVAHKERLKALKADVHILTLTATPIPRTLQMALSGIRDLSIIASPPVDRLAVRTYVLPFDPVVVREALLREHYRGGQSFFVVPRISDLEEITNFLREDVPEIKFIVGHGQMTPSTLEDVMTAFYEGRYDVLLSTTIVESGIDIPRANTLIVHRSDQFGLAQLYQLRGRVGRSKIRAYAYLTTPPGRVLTTSATKRLEVLQTLDTLGAGFSIASHDMDIRGAGNLLGDEQSGHIKEVGVELYQSMLEEAVANARAAGEEEMRDRDWSPQINLGATVMIPEAYVPDLSQRMALYRRLADLDTREAVDEFCAELIDRFGPLPSAVKQLAAVTIIKAHAKRGGIEKLDAGPKGITLAFRDSTFANPAGLVDFISGLKVTAKIRPDHSLFIAARAVKIGDRLKTVAQIARKLGDMAAKGH